MKRMLAVIMVLSTALAAQAATPIAPRLERALAAGTGPVAVWVTFTDKGLDGAALDDALAAAERQLAPRALARRAKATAPGTRLVDARDLALSPDYVAAVAATGARRGASRAG